MWNRFLQMLGARRAEYSPAWGVWGPANTSGGVYPVPHSGEEGEAHQSVASGLEWYSGGVPYPVVERTDGGAGDSPPPGIFRKLGPELNIAHGNNRRYWKMTPLDGPIGEPEVASLQQVCWLQVSHKFQGVPVGVYEVVWRVAVERPISFDGRWTVKLDAPEDDSGKPSDEGTSTDMHLSSDGLPSTASSASRRRRAASAAEHPDIDVRHHSPHVRISVLRDQETDEGFIHTLSSKESSQRLHRQLEAAATPQGRPRKFSSVRLGAIKVSRDATDVTCSLVGGNSWWCHGLDIHYVELRRLPMPWKCERLMWLAQKDGSKSPLATLPEPILRQIISLCHRGEGTSTSPLDQGEAMLDEEEVEEPGSSGITQESLHW